jgi:hypothetical protein
VPAFRRCARRSWLAVSLTCENQHSGPRLHPPWEKK